MPLVVPLRAVTGTFVSIYVTAWLGLSLLQGLAFQWWREASGKKAGALALEERGDLG